MNCTSTLFQFSICDEEEEYITAEGIERFRFVVPSSSERRWMVVCPVPMVTFNQSPMEVDIPVLSCVLYE